MTKSERVKELGLQDLSFDYALPQPWVDEVHKIYPHHYDVIVGGFIWAYDSMAPISGRPIAITSDAAGIYRDLPDHLK